MSIKTTKFLVAPLRGIDQRWDTRPNHAANIENMTWSDQDSWRTSQGYRPVVADYIPERNVTLPGTEITVSQPIYGTETNAYDNESTPNSIYWFSQHGSALQWLLYEDQSGRLLHFNGSKAPQIPFTILQYTDGQEFDATDRRRAASISQKIANTSFAMFGTNCYIVNGQDAPLVYDGKKVTRAGFSGRPNKPNAFITEKTEVSDNFTMGVGFANSENEFKYAVSFVNERGQESRLSVASGTVRWDTTATGLSTMPATNPGYTQVVCVNIPTGPPGTVARRLYRTINLVTFIEGTSVVTIDKEKLFGQEFYFVNEIQDNFTEFYVDGASDFDVGALVLHTDFGDFPNNANYITVYQNTVFVASGMNSDVFYSAPLAPENFPPNNVFNFGDTQSSEITGLYATRDALLVFKRRGVYLIKGSPRDGFIGMTLSSDVGCSCIQSVRELPGVGLVFLGHDGVYILDGTLSISSQQTRFIKLSQGLRDIVRRINFEFAEFFRSVIYHRDREYWLTVALDDKKEPDTVLKFNYEAGVWSVYTNFNAAGMIESQDHRGYLYFAGNDTLANGGAKGIFVYGSTNTKNDLGAVSSVYETVNIPFNNVYENFSPARVQARVVGYGNTLAMSVITNRDPVDIATTADGTQQRALEDLNFPVYNTAETSTGLTYKEHRPIIIRMDISTMHKGPVNELKLRFTCTGEMEIISYVLEGRVGGSRDVINLTRKFGGSETR